MTLSSEPRPFTQKSENTRMLRMTLQYGPLRRTSPYQGNARAVNITHERRCISAEVPITRQTIGYTLWDRKTNKAVIKDWRLHQ
jgi:hypothetical protein